MSAENTKNTASIMEITSGFDYDEDITIGAADIDFDDPEEEITDFGGILRSNYYCRGIHNTTSDSMTIKYQLFGQDSGSGFRTVTIPAGTTCIMFVNVAVIGGTGSGSTAGLINVKWKAREHFSVMYRDRI
jgi:hypothetical protein